MLHFFYYFTGSGFFRVRAAQTAKVICKFYEIYATSH
jgi:hypothetical protein